jgi:hypothetical protein
LLAFVGLTAAILIGAVIPLGVQASAHDYAAYIEDAQSRARTAAASAEEQLSDHLQGPAGSSDPFDHASEGARSQVGPERSGRCPTTRAASATIVVAVTPTKPLRVSTVVQVSMESGRSCTRSR